MPYIRSDFNGTFLNFMLLLKFGAPSRMGTRGKLPTLSTAHLVRTVCTNAVTNGHTVRGNYGCGMCILPTSTLAVLPLKSLAPFGFSPVHCTNAQIQIVNGALCLSEAKIPNVLIPFPPANAGFTYTLSLT